MKIESKILIPHVYLLKFETQYELCMSFVRMQEFYESQKFRGRYFTLEQYIDYWSKEFGNGSFTYPSVWNGFNIPGNILYNWIKEFEAFEDIRKRENDILRQIRKLMRKEMGFTLLDSEDMEKIYVIGTHEKNEEEIIQHELAHAMYYLNTEYRKKCNELLRRLDKETYEKCKKWCLNRGYCKKVINDEMQAYFSTSDCSTSDCVSHPVISRRKDFENNFQFFKKKSQKNN